VPWATLNQYGLGASFRVGDDSLGTAASTGTASWVEWAVRESHTPQLPRNIAGHTRPYDPDDAHIGARPERPGKGRSRPHHLRHNRKIQEYAPND